MNANDPKEAPPQYSSPPPGYDPYSQPQPDLSQPFIEQPPHQSPHYQMQPFPQQPQPQALVQTIPHGYPYAIPNLLNPETNTTWSTLNFISNDPINHARFPKSSALLQELSQKFGPHNICAPPDWLTTDQQRKDWLKRDHNALLYFFHKRESKKAKLQKVLDYPMCLICCAPTYYEDKNKVNKSNAFTGSCGVCCVECTTWCCCLWVFSPIDKRRFFAAESDASIFDNSVCCPVCSGGIKFRQQLIDRLKKSGLKYSENSCSTFLSMCFCWICFAMHTTKVINTAYYLRYGTMYGEQQAFDKHVCDENSNLIQYYKDAQDSPNHPYYRAQRALPGRSMATGQTMTIIQLNELERSKTGFGPVADLFYEFYKPNKTIAAHNNYWKGVHQITNLEMK